MWAVKFDRVFELVRVLAPPVGPGPKVVAHPVGLGAAVAHGDATGIEGGDEHAQRRGVVWWR